MIRGQLIQHAISLWNICRNRGTKWVKNDMRWVRAICLDENCPFYVYGAWVKKLHSFQIRKFTKEHECNKVYSNKLVTCAILAELLDSKVKNEPFIRNSVLREFVKKEFGVEVSMIMVKRAKKQILDSTVINHEEEYKQLWSYANIIRQTNPGSTVKMLVKRCTADSPPVLDRYYIFFEALKSGFRYGCRKFLGLDGCFLKTLVKGELLCAVGRDGDNTMYPVAWAIVETESAASWKWFIERLQDDLYHLGQGNGWTIMTDQQKVINAFNFFKAIW